MKRRSEQGWIQEFLRRGVNPSKEVPTQYILTVFYAMYFKYFKNILWN